MNEDIAIFVLLGIIYLNLSLCWLYLSWVFRGMPTTVCVLDEIITGLCWPIDMNLLIIRRILMEIRRRKSQRK